MTAGQLADGLEVQGLALHDPIQVRDHLTLAERWVLVSARLGRRRWRQRRRRQRRRRRRGGRQGRRRRVRRQGAITAAQLARNKELHHFALGLLIDDLEHLTLTEHWVFVFAPLGGKRWIRRRWQRRRWRRRGGRQRRRGRWKWRRQRAITAAQLAMKDKVRGLALSDLIDEQSEL